MRKNGAGLRRARGRFFFSLALLCCGLIYTVSPIDLIPDVLGPIGWVDDLGALALSCVYAGYSYFSLRRARRAAR